MYIFAMKNCFIKSHLNFLKHLIQRKNTNHYYMLLEVVGMWKIKSEASNPKEKETKQKSIRKGVWSKNKATQG